MTKAEKKFVIAWTHAQARHFAQTMDWTRSEWHYIEPRAHEKMLGLYNILVYDVRAPRYRPTQIEAENMDRMQAQLQIMALSGRIARINVVNLP